MTDVLKRLRRNWRAGRCEPDVPIGHPFPELAATIADAQASLDAAVRAVERCDDEGVRFHLILTDRAGEPIPSLCNRELAARYGNCDDETGPW